MASRDPNLGDKAADLIAEMGRGRSNSAATGASATASRPPRSRQRLLLYVLAALLVVAGVQVLIASGLFSNDATIPDELVGVWHTTAPTHADRAFEITKTTLTLHRGVDSTVHAIERVRTEEGEDGTLYTLDYSGEGELFEFAFYYVQSQQVIQFKNQRGMDWRK